VSFRKVLMLAAALESGGLERQLSLLASHLPASWRPVVWSAGDGPFRRVLEEQGVATVVRPRHGRLDVRPALQLARLITSCRPDVVHAWHWLPAAVAAPVCRAAGIPFVDGTIRLGRPHEGIGGPSRAVMRMATVVVANSRAGLDAWHVSPAKARVVYNGFDDVRLAEALTATPPSRLADRFTVVMTGRMSSHKDFATVIEAAQLLASDETSSDWRFLLVGDGVLRERLQADAGRLVATGVVEFVAPGLEVLPLVASADAGVLMTNDRVHAEGCSNSIMEYMACGLPVVCCDSGGNRELVADGVNGWLVPPGDAPALAARLETLRVSGRSAVMGAAGRDILRKEFSVERMVSAYVDVYEGCLRR
jgi:glycosyltransferase involved in cell wall biosynthesis